MRLLYLVLLCFRIAASRYWKVLSASSKSVALVESHLCVAFLSARNTCYALGLLLWRLR